MLFGRSTMVLGKFTMVLGRSYMESSFKEVDVAETEEFLEHDPGEPEGNMNKTEQVVWMLP